MTTPATEIIAAGEPTAETLAYRAKRTAPNTIDVFMDNVREGWEQWFLAITDAHWDNPHCRQELGHRFMRQAVERGAGIFFPGDAFCAMQGKFDKRSNKSALRPEHQQGNYLDALVDTMAVDLMPYRANILFIAKGNHETSVLNRLETDLTVRLAEKLGVEPAGYAGWLRFFFSRGKSNKISKKLFFFHGSNGGGEVTRGTIQTARRAVVYPDADYILTGHIHEDVQVTIPRSRVAPSGHEYIDEQLHIIGPTLKQEFDLAGGWHIETGKPPKPIGSTWLHFYYDTHARGNVGFQVERAK